MGVGQSFAGIAGPLGQPSQIVPAEQVVFTTNGLGLVGAYPTIREYLRAGTAVTVISGFKSADQVFWTSEGDKVQDLHTEYGDQLTLIYTTSDGTFGVQGSVTTALEGLLKTQGSTIERVMAFGPAFKIQAIAEQTKEYGVPCFASLNSIMVDAMGLCGACMVPVIENGTLVRKHACIDGPEFDAHSVDWEKYLPRFTA